jgi:hypothetical protein
MSGSRSRRTVQANPPKRRVSSCCNGELLQGGQLHASVEHQQSSLSGGDQSPFRPVYTNAKPSPLRIPMFDFFFFFCCGSSKLDEEQRIVAEQLKDEFEKNGVNLSAEKRAQVVELQNRIYALSSQFMSNIFDSEKRNIVQSMFSFFFFRFVVLFFTTLY